MDCTYGKYSSHVRLPVCQKPAFGPLFFLLLVPPDSSVPTKTANRPRAAVAIIFSLEILWIILPIVIDNIYNIPYSFQHSICRYVLLRWHEKVQFAMVEGKSALMVSSWTVDHRITLRKLDCCNHHERPLIFSFGCLSCTDFHQDVDRPQTSLQLWTREPSLGSQASPTRKGGNSSGSNSIDSFGKAAGGRQNFGILQHCRRSNHPYGVTVARWTELSNCSTKRLNFFEIRIAYSKLRLAFNLQSIILFRLPVDARLVSPCSKCFQVFEILVPRQ